MMIIEDVWHKKPSMGYISIKYVKEKLWENMHMI